MLLSFAGRISDFGERSATQDRPPPPSPSSSSSSMRTSPDAGPGYRSLFPLCMPLKHRGLGDQQRMREVVMIVNSAKEQTDLPQSVENGNAQSVSRVKLSRGLLLAYLRGPRDNLLVPPGPGPRSLLITSSAWPYRRCARSRNPDSRSSAHLRCLTTPEEIPRVLPAPGGPSSRPRVCKRHLYHGHTFADGPRHTF